MRENQNAQILRYLLNGGSLSPREASELFGCDRLSARIYDLRHAGFKILADWECKLDFDGKVVKKWKRYRIAK